MTKGFERVVRSVIKTQKPWESVYGTPMGDAKMYWDETGFHMIVSPTAREYWENDAFAPADKKARDSA